jgi:hypothetical protein
MLTALQKSCNSSECSEACSNAVLHSTYRSSSARTNEKGRSGGDSKSKELVPHGLRLRSRKEGFEVMIHGSIATRVTDGIDSSTSPVCIVPIESKFERCRGRAGTAMRVCVSGRESRDNGSFPPKSGSNNSGSKFESFGDLGHLHSDSMSFDASIPGYFGDRMAYSEGGFGGSNVF